MLTSATISADGKSFTIEGNEYKATYGSTTYDEVIVALSVFAYLSEAEGDNEEGWYSLNSMEELELPAAFTKSAGGTSSVKKTIKAPVRDYSMTRKARR